uniref:Uncharacterized protein LOC110218944 n=1 Tax=Phascolarctos cinereus TaxID=38626 RepID=A0A6P5LH39_PHACI|nr:uncharacterized protein LOC110218944 [Phascolarctos cinereus]
MLPSAPPPRSFHSPSHRPRPAAEERTSSGAPIGCSRALRQPAPTRTAEYYWLAGRLVPTARSYWCVVAPWLQDRSSSSLSLSPSTPTRFHQVRRGRGRGWRELQLEAANRGSASGAEVGLILALDPLVACRANGRVPHGLGLLPPRGSPGPGLLARATGQGHTRVLGPATLRALPGSPRPTEAIPKDKDVPGRCPRPSPDRDSGGVLAAGHHCVHGTLAVPYVGPQASS